MLLNKNPFFVLGASARDTRQRIVELAEERSLHIDQETCSRCKAELINPRQRLAAELAWLPGCSTGSAEELVSTAINWVGGVLPVLASPLATANLHITALAFGPAGGRELGEALLDVARTCERIDASEVRALLNEDRTAAGFSRIDKDTEVQRGLDTRLVDYRTVLAGILKRLPVHQLTPVLTRALEQGTAHGTTHGPSLLHSLMDVLSLDLKTALDAKLSAVEKAMEEVRAAGAVLQPETLERALDHLSGAIRQWDWFAQPLQLSAQARGQDHQPSRELAVSIRGLAIELHNEHNLTEAAQKISEMIHESFAELPRMAEVVQNDLAQLETLASQRAEEREFFAGMQKIDDTPAMGTINGIGTKLYGRENYHEATRTYTATLYFVVLFVPVIPLARYRVRDADGGGWYFIGKMPYGKTQRYHLGAVLGGLLLWFLISMSGSQSRNTIQYTDSYTTPTRTNETYANPLVGAGGGTSAPAPGQQSNYFQAPGALDSLMASATPSSNRPGSSKTSATGSRRALQRWIEAERVRLEGVEAEIKAMDRDLESQSSDIESLKRRLGYLDLVAVDGKLPSDEYYEYERLRVRHNTLIDTYNAQLRKRKARYAAYSQAVDAANDSVEVYNRLR